MKLGISIAILFFSSLTIGQVELPNSKALLKTSLGDILIKLHIDKAPSTVTNFVALAKGEKSYTDIKTGKTVRNKAFYNGMIFHKIHPKLGIQTGCPLGDGRGWPGYVIRSEANPKMKFDRRFLVGLSHLPGQKGSGGSQFFITTERAPHLDGQYTIFGEVILGQDVVINISKQPRDAMMRPQEKIVLNEVIIE